MFTFTKLYTKNVFFVLFLIDSDEGEAGLGNVTRVIMRPVGHSGKAKKGHLCFDASFETGKYSISKI